MMIYSPCIIFDCNWWLYMKICDNRVKISLLFPKQHWTWNTLVVQAAVWYLHSKRGGNSLVTLTTKYSSCGNVKNSRDILSRDTMLLDWIVTQWLGHLQWGTRRTEHMPYLIGDLGQLHGLRTAAQPTVRLEGLIILSSEHLVTK